ncbi:hypothetical protein ACVLD2_002266 [Paenibacillus sp. PvR052]
MFFRWRSRAWGKKSLVDHSGKPESEPMAAVSGT